MNRRLREHRLAVTSFALASALWACGTPVGESVGTFTWSMTEYDMGDGQPAHVLGEVRGRVHLFGAPSGPFRRGRVEWHVEVLRPDAPPEVVDATPALEAEVLRRFPDAASPVGWHMDGSALAASAWLGSIFFLLTSAWWLVVRSRPHEPSLRRALLTTLGLSLWPWLLGTSLSWFLWGRAGRPMPAVPLLVDPHLLLSGTALLLSACLVHLLRPRDAGEAEGP
ncbi:MAG: hypothetical protein KF878_16460 [Planctomycetes bacterium]|nr:hypothetical protein [Planctomycetota bacterium]